MNRLIIIACAASAVFVGCAGGSSALDDAAATCEIELDSDGQSVSFDRVAAEEDPGDATITDVVCVLVELDVPDRVISRIDSTRALDGTIEDDWTVDGDRFDAFWTYHPDSGLNITIYQED